MIKNTAPDASNNYHKAALYSFTMLVGTKVWSLFPCMTGGEFASNINQCMSDCFLPIFDIYDVATASNTEASNWREHVFVPNLWCLLFVVLPVLNTQYGEYAGPGTNKHDGLRRVLDDASAPIAGSSNEFSRHNFSAHVDIVPHFVM